MTLLITIIRPILNGIFVVAMFFVPRKKSTGKKLLVIKLEGLGDFIIFLPSLLRYKKIYPDYSLTLLVDNKINYSIAKRYGKDVLDEVLLIDAKKFSKKLWYRFSFSKLLYKENYDVTINPLYYRRKISDFIVRIAGSKEKISYAGYEIEHGASKKSSDFYTQLVYVPQTLTNEFYRHKYFTEKLGYTGNDVFTTTFPFRNEDVDSARAVLAKYFLQEKEYVVFFPGAGRFVSKWEPEKFAHVADFLVEKNYTVVIVGSKMEKEIAAKIISNLNPKSREKVLDLTDGTDVFTTAGVISLAKFYLGNDSGPTHLSEAIGATVICPLGLGHFMEFYPSQITDKNIIVSATDKSCLNDLYACAKDLPFGSPAPCVSNITVEQILTEVKKLV
jgi:ADP-heptose:LPS heptosyltransferase